MKAVPRATSAAYDAARHRIEIELQDGSAVAIPVVAIDALVHASPDQLFRIRALAGGRVLACDGLGADISVPRLLHDLAGVDAGTAASVMGRKGGAAATEAKTTASRANGSKGGRPLTTAGFIRLLDRMLRTTVAGIDFKPTPASATWAIGELELYVKMHGSSELQIGRSWTHDQPVIMPKSRVTAQVLADEIASAAGLLA